MTVMFVSQQFPEHRSLVFRRNVFWVFTLTQVALGIAATTRTDGDSRLLPRLLFLCW